MSPSLSSEINQRRIRCLYEVYSSGSACAAADNLTTSAAVVTRHIQLLEKELGILLFERCHRNGMKPTEAAKIVFEYYRASRAQQDHMKTCLDELRSMKRGTIRLALPAAYIDMLMEDMFTDFCHEHPNLNIVVEEINNSSQIVASVLEDSADVGIIFNNIPNPDTLCYANRLLPMRALVSRRHPLAREQKVSFAVISLPASLAT